MMNHSTPDAYNAPDPSPSKGGHQSNVSRRRFLQVGLIGGALAAAGASRLPTSEASTTSKAKYALIVDAAKCTGCGACADACNLRNDLPQDLSYIRYCGQGKDGNEWCLPVQCQHCADAPCETVCPTGATYHTKDGVVLVNEKLCVGCRYCEVACPYQARRFDHERGVANKCWLCLDYVLGGGEPACVHACLHGARIFGRLDDPGSRVAKLVASGEAKPFHPEFGTDPAIVYYVLE
jgi:Fe-S-cluster-containing dehydrogenase component